jgi:hypothetical protein
MRAQRSITSSYAVFDQTGKIAPDMVAWKHMDCLCHFPPASATKAAPHGFAAARMIFEQRHHQSYVLLAAQLLLSSNCIATRTADGDGLQRDERKRGWGA